MKAQLQAAHGPSGLPQAALLASRQMWLAGLGAAVVSRDWIQHEAGRSFKTLVQQGTVVESGVIRAIGSQIEGTVLRANAMWQHTRATVQGSLRNVANRALAMARHVLPRSPIGARKASKAALSRPRADHKAPSSSTRPPAKRAPRRAVR